MNYFDVWVADSRFRAGKALTYSSDDELSVGSVITIPLRAKMTTAFVAGRTKKPTFATKPIKNVLSNIPMPAHCLPLASWMSEYYATSLGECLRQFAPSKPSVRAVKKPPELPITDYKDLKMVLDAKLTGDQTKAIKEILDNPSNTVLLHGQTGSGKTRVYLELAKKTIATRKSVIILTPEISLINQLQNATSEYLGAPSYVLHSQLPDAQRKKLWLKILESKEPVVIIGPRSALFAPVQNPGLIILDEAHEPAYKQEQSPRYQTARVASQMGNLTDAKVVLGTATPNVNDYYLACQKKAVVTMNELAVKSAHGKTDVVLVDIKKRDNFTKNPYISNQMIEAVSKTISGGKQALVYLNRRGSARLILCGKCGWQLLCPHCDIPLVYHGDKHLAICHTCGYNQAPPLACPECQNNEIIYNSIGTKSLTEMLQKLFPNHTVGRYDSDSASGETINDDWANVHSGKVDILVGTQLLAKGLDLPRLGLVGIITAESSLSLPDFTAEERTFALLYQVMGRVGRGHTPGQVVLQSYQPDNPIITAAVARDYESFYKNVITERQQFRFPPYAYLLKLVVRRATPKGAETAANNLVDKLRAGKLPVEIIGPAPSFFGKRGKNYYWQIVIKSKDRKHLLALSALTPPDWSIDLDPANLL